MRHMELNLDNQLCFPLYAASRAVTRSYKPLLDKIGLTYTQYITMMALWERSPLTVNELGARLFLDSGTLTPLLKKLEQKGLVTRTRAEEDNRRVYVSLTPEGDALEDQAASIPRQMAQAATLSQEDAAELYRILHQMLGDHRPEAEVPACADKNS